MSDALPSLTLANEDPLFQRLENGHALITPHPTQARILRQRYQAWRLSRDESHWRSPRILSWDAWLDQLWDDASLAGAPGTDLTVPGPRQIQSTWEAVLRDSPPARNLLQAESLAAELMRTRRLAVEWKVPLDGPDWSGDELENGAAFRRWNQAFEQACARRSWLPAEARVAKLATAVRAVPTPLEGPLDLIGFDELSPARQNLLQALQDGGARITRLSMKAASSPACLWRAGDHDAELRRMALAIRRWLVEKPGARIAVVVPDLQDRRTAIENHLVTTLVPGSDPAAAPPWNVSPGLPLLRHPMIADAFDWLELARRQTDIQQVSRVLRSPWLGGAQEERAPRALLEQRLRSRFTRELRSNDLWYQAAVHADAPPVTAPGEPPPWKCPRLAAQLHDLARMAGDASRKRPPSDWAETVDALLRAAGWPATESPESRQALQAWRECLTALASLDSTVNDYTRDQALAELRSICRDSVYRPAGSPSGLWVLRPEEAAGLQFDHAWVSGLDGDNWPPAARPNPFIPARLQHKHGLPGASPERQLEAARRVTRSLQSSVPGCVFSYAAQTGAEEVLPSPLFEGFKPMESTELPADAMDTWEARIMAAPGAEAQPLESPGAPSPDAVRGGSRMLRHQSLCPFRAFAAHRLQAEPLETPFSGVSPALHGSLLHRCLELFWTQTASHAALVSLDEAALGERVAEHVARALDGEPSLRFRDALRAVEARRLTRHLLEYLQLERERAPFTVARLEQLIEPEVAGQPIRLFIDRVDRLEDGSEVIIDYKSGKVHPGHWFTDRPEDPQLPLYAVAAGTPPAAVAFAVIRDDGCEYRGVTTREGLLPGLPPRRSHWTEQLLAAGEDMPGTIANWRQVLHRLMADFLAGEAAVDPRNDRRTCAETYCQFQSLCRIDELDPVHFEVAEDTP
ncbi:MAG: hypothetical protein HKN58_05045 [Xanthomonadales bacterium]|nr:hypothetical protein [Xanthomonadales bacterium]